MDEEFRNDQVHILKKQHNDLSIVLNYINKFTVKTYIGVFHRISMKRRWSLISMTTMLLICDSDKKLMKLWKSQDLPVASIELNPGYSDELDANGNIIKINLWVDFVFSVHSCPPLLTNDQFDLIRPWFLHIQNNLAQGNLATTNLIISSFARIIQTPQIKITPMILRNMSNDPQMVSSIFVPISLILGEQNFTTIIPQKNISALNTDNNFWSLCFVVLIQDPVTKTDLKFFQSETIPIKYKGSKPFFIKNLINVFVDSRSFSVPKNPRTEKQYTIIETIVSPTYHHKNNDQDPVSIITNHYQQIQSIPPDILFNFLYHFHPL